MKEKLPYSVSLLLSSVALALLVVTIALSVSNHAKQSRLEDRQAQIAGSQALIQLNQGVIRLMASLSVKNNDSQLRSLLATNGIMLGEENAVARPNEKK